MIKVLWLEDEINKIEAFLDRLYMDGISVTHKDTANNFIAELNKNLDDYDAVILDVMGVVNSLEEKPTSKAFSVAHKEVLGLKHKKDVPFFVLSAQLTKDENQGLKEYIGDTHIYIKSKDEEKLIEDIKSVVDEQPDFILRNKFADVLSVFNENQIGTNHYDRIFNLIKWAESSQDIDRSEDQLTGIRKIIEAIFHALAKQGLVPTEITNSQGWLNGTRNFLSNRHDVYVQNQSFVHPTVSDSIHRLINIVQDGSHAEGGLRLRVDDYIQTNQSDYLFKSCIYLLFDIIIWYKNLCQKYPDIEINKTFWLSSKSDDWITGTITQIQINGFGTFKPDNSPQTIGVVPKIMEDNSFKENDRVRVTTKKDSTGTKTYIDLIEKI
jgi:hypothetical protein